MSIEVRALRVLGRQTVPVVVSQCGVNSRDGSRGGPPHSP